MVTLQRKCCILVEFTQIGHFSEDFSSLLNNSINHYQIEGAAHRRGLSCPRSLFRHFIQVYYF